MDEQLKVSITGDASGLEKASQQAANALDNVTETVQQADKTWKQFVGERMGSYMKQFGSHGAAIKKIGEEWKDYKASLASASQATVQVSASLSTSTKVMAQSAAVMGGSLKKGSGEATQSLINLSRVAQDAPYGFIGIANNLNPLLESFQRLKQSTGTVGGSLKALGSELMGAGGIGLALGVVSSLLVVFGDKLFSSGNAAKTQADKLKEAKQVLQDYIESLNDINKATLLGKQSAQEQLVALQTLYKATQNANIPLADRKKLVDELQEQYPKYFANISDEIILAGGAKKAYDQLSSAILASAKARAAQDSIVDIQKNVLGIEQQIAGNAAEQLKLQQRISALRKGPQTFLLQGEEKLTNEARKANDLQKSLNNLIASGNDLRKQKNELDTRSNQLANLAQSIVQQNPQALLKPDAKIPTPKVDKEKSKKDDEELKKLLEEKKKILTDFQRDFETLKLPVPNLSLPLEKITIPDLTKELRDKLNDALLQQPLKLKLPPIDFQAIDPKKIPIPLKMNFQIEKEISDQEKAQEQIRQTIDSFNKTLESTIESGVVNVADALGGALVGGDFSAVFASVAASVGGLLQELGKLLIQTAIKVEIFKQALYDWAVANPALAIAAGVGLIAFGAAIKKTVLPRPQKFAKGGWVPGQGSGDTVPAMLTPGEFVVTKDKAPFIASLLKMMGAGLKMPKMGDGVFKFATGGFVPQIKSTDQRSPLSRVQNIIQPVQNMVAVPQGEWKIRGKDLVFAMAQTQKSQRRAT